MASGYPAAAATLNKRWPSVFSLRCQAAIPRLKVAAASMSFDGIVGDLYDGCPTFLNPNNLSFPISRLTSALSTVAGCADSTVSVTPQKLDVGAEGVLANVELGRDIALVNFLYNGVSVPKASNGGSASAHSSWNCGPHFTTIVEA